MISGLKDRHESQLKQENEDTKATVLSRPGGTHGSVKKEEAVVVKLENLKKEGKHQMDLDEEISDVESVDGDDVAEVVSPETRPRESRYSSPPEINIPRPRLVVRVEIPYRPNPFRPSATEGTYDPKNLTQARFGDDRGTRKYSKSAKDKNGCEETGAVYSWYSLRLAIPTRQVTIKKSRLFDVFLRTCLCAFSRSRWQKWTWNPTSSTFIFFVALGSSRSKYGGYFHHFMSPPKRPSACQPIPEAQLFNSSFSPRPNPSQPTCFSSQLDDVFSTLVSDRFPRLGP
ncbi:hypothetical protein NLJ89_g9636 [Agrocybe chaxingu]|uniref:Uncharacterized protein n=1 Tax=Agrocybe chaxingu TaxID=84603 RepID=A0A9W8MTD0_9AGAR|nr:hypothetical protein NLJ89_g9636 [Agrocybe chaxingu]